MKEQGREGDPLLEGSVHSGIAADMLDAMMLDPPSVSESRSRLMIVTIITLVTNNHHVVVAVAAAAVRRTPSSRSSTSPWTPSWSSTTSTTSRPPTAPAPGRQNTYPHPRIPAARLLFEILCFFPCVSSTWENPEVGGGNSILGS